jgi:hypothetical protein
MKRWAPLLLLFAIGLTFLILNRAAYKGYFQDDEFDNILATRDVSPADWTSWFLTPRLSKDNFRPAGHIYFYAMNRLAGLRFPSWITPLHALHLLNTLLLWLLLRRFQINPYAAAAGAAFFALNVSAFDVYWKPMYVFDLLCATFALATLNLYARGNWLAAVPAMWLAYKSKELAVMLPVVLLAYEYWFGNRNWKRLAPFFLISLCFGIQALLSPQPKGSPYAFVLTPAAFWQTLQFYSARLFLAPFAGLLLLVIPFLIRDRRVFLGATILVAFFAPLMFLPLRLYPAYTYVPLIGAAIELSVVAALLPLVATLLFFAAWIPWNIHELRADRKMTLTADDQVRVYATGLMDFARRHPDPPILAIYSKPASFQVWGIRAALSYPNPNPRSPLQLMDQSEAVKLGPNVPVTFVKWDPEHNQIRFLAKNPDDPGSSYLTMGPETPFWQLIRGWYDLDSYFRWTEPHATARLFWPPEASEFEMVLNVSPSLLSKNGYVEVRPALNGHTLETHRFDRVGIQSSRWNLPQRDNPVADVELTFQPASRFPPDPRLLGAPVVSFGFVTSNFGHKTAIP